MKQIRAKRVRCVLDPLAEWLLIHHRDLASPALLQRLLPLALKRQPPRVWRTRPRKPEVATPDVICLPEGIGTPEKVYPKLADIMRAICDKHSTPERPINSDLLKSPMRKAWIIPIRNEFYYEALAQTVQSFPQIGKFCGGRNHTTVYYGISAYCQQKNLPNPRQMALMDVAGKNHRLKQWSVKRAATDETMSPT